MIPPSIYFPELLFLHSTPVIKIFQHNLLDKQGVLCRLLPKQNGMGRKWEEGTMRGYEEQRKSPGVGGTGIEHLYLTSDSIAVYYSLKPIKIMLIDKFIWT